MIAFIEWVASFKTFWSFFWIVQNFVLYYVYFRVGRRRGQIDAAEQVGRLLTIADRQQRIMFVMQAHLENLRQRLAEARNGQK